MNFMLPLKSKQTIFLDIVHTNPDGDVLVDLIKEEDRLKYNRIALGDLYGLFK